MPCDSLLDANFNPFLVSLSVGFAGVFAVGGLWIGIHSRDELLQKIVWRRFGGAPAMGAAISAMHYVGMASTTFSAIRSSAGRQSSIRI